MEIVYCYPISYTKHSKCEWLMATKNDIRIQNARIFYNGQHPIDAPNNLRIIVECIEQLVSVSPEGNVVIGIRSEKEGECNDGNIGKNKE